MKNRTPLTILMPSLNEEASIEMAIDSIPLHHLHAAGYDVEVLLVDGGSTDRTVEFAEKKGVRVIVSRPGYGFQHRTGMTAARGDVIITADSDHSYPLEDSPALLHLLEKEQLDFITTNRFAGMEKDSMQIINRVGNTVLTLITNRLFGLRLKDSQSGMWVIRKIALERLDLKSDGMSFSQEIKIEAFSKLRAAEVNSRYRKRTGQVKLQRFRDGWGNLVHLFSKWWVAP